MMRPGLLRLDQAARDALREHHRRGQVGRHRGVPGRARQGLGAAGRRNSGVVDQNIDSAEFRSARSRSADRDRSSTVMSVWTPIAAHAVIVRQICRRASRADRRGAPPRRRRRPPSRAPCAQSTPRPDDAPVTKPTWPREREKRLQRIHHALTPHQRAGMRVQAAASAAAATARSISAPLDAVMRDGAKLEPGSRAPTSTPRSRSAAAKLRRPLGAAVDVEEHHVGAPASPDCTLMPATRPSPSARARAFRWSSASRSTIVVKRDDPGRRDYPRLAHPAAQHLAHAPRPFDEFARCRRASMPTGHARPFERQNETVSACAAIRLGAGLERERGVEDARAVEMHRRARGDAPVRRPPPCARARPPRRRSGYACFPSRPARAARNARRADVRVRLAIRRASSSPSSVLRIGVITMPPSAAAPPAS